MKNGINSYGWINEFIHSFIYSWASLWFVNQVKYSLHTGLTALSKIIFLLRTAGYLKMNNNRNYLKILKSLDSYRFTIMYIRFEAGYWDSATQLKDCFDPTMPDNQYNYRTAAELK